MTCRPLILIRNPKFAIRNRFVFGLLFALCAFPSIVTQAQSATATVSGTVEDQNGAVVPGVSITIQNRATSLERQATTNDAGYFTIPLLSPGTYTITARHDGFTTAEIRDVVLNVGDQKAFQVQLKTGNVNETVNVTAETPLINESPAVGIVVDRKFVANTPLNGRSFQDLISMTPGVVSQNPNTGGGGLPGQAGDFSVNGQRTESNYYTVDGVSANVSAGTAGAVNGNLLADAAASGSIPAGTALGTTQSIVSIDALQEFRVQSSSYSAEFGRGPGGQFSFVTRSGTNDFHGTLFDYFRNDVFDANDWFNNSLGKAKSPLRQNDFGGTLGGPVFLPRFGEGGNQPGYNGRNRTFFFFSYEGLRLVLPQPASTTQLVPDLFMRQQAPAALQPILNAFPLPNGVDFGTAAAPSLAQFIQPFSLPSHIDSYSLRLDHSFGSRLSLFYRFSDTPTFTQARGTSGSVSVLSNNNYNTSTHTFGVTSRISQRSTNDFRLGYARSTTSTEGIEDNFGGAAPTNVASLSTAGAFPQARYQVQITVAGAGTAALRNQHSNNQVHQLNLVDTFTIVMGSHQLKMGFDYRRIVSPTTPADPFVIGAFSNATAVITNRINTAQVTRTLSATPIFDEYSAFVQDEWKVVPRLNLSFGLRWEADPPPHDANGNDAFTIVGDLSNPSSVTLAPRGTPLWKTSWNNFAPRLGLVWTARKTSGWETILRAGGGVFFDTNDKVATSGFNGGAIGFGITGTYSNVPFPLTATQLNISPSTALPTTANVYAFPRNLKLPYTLQWNVGVSQSLGRNQTITLSYVGASARRLQGQQSFSYRPLNSNFNSIIFFRTDLTSNYNALQAQFQRRVSRGLDALGSYTWSHCIDFGSSDGSLPFARGNCDMDLRHNLEFGASWDLPKLNERGVAEKVLRDWGLDGRLMARSGFPVSLLGNQVIDPSTGSRFFAGLNLIAGQPIYLYGSQYPGGRAVNPAAFATTTGTNIGSAPRNFVRGFGAWQINLALRRRFSLGERIGLQFRAEVFNILNHPNFGRVDGTRTSATFGRAVNMLNQGLITMASQYQQGGPRSMQFALRLTF